MGERSKSSNHKEGKYTRAPKRVLALFSNRIEATVSTNFDLTVLIAAIARGEVPIIALLRESSLAIATSSVRYNQHLD